MFICLICIHYTSKLRSSYFTVNLFTISPVSVTIYCLYYVQYIACSSRFAVYNRVRNETELLLSPLTILTTKVRTL
ncbi:hypothetical protein AQUCO_05500074v1 [Aquilegia coerulea]|uniref:Uncharacterized protein n=1 Tax=Aquilegia coerulea TaxID=218851 RepID=A0A2G5CGX8_AQUCA|nr:hypothetical protein AQUCO_05500074v1 [Aquilegia coerulea]